jgi:RND family efflux transporter MFP subunit
MAWMAAVMLAVSATGARAQTGPGVSTGQLVAEFAGVKAVTRPSRDAVMGFALPTEVREILVRGGESVKKGQLLVRGDDAEALAGLELQRLTAGSDFEVRKAEMAAELAELTFRRTEQARAGGGATQQELDRDRLTRDAARIDVEFERLRHRQQQIRVRQFEAAVDRLRLTAPFDGQVDQVMVDVGQIVRETERILRIVQVDPVWIDVNAPTEVTVALGIKHGDRAWVLVDLGSRLAVLDARVIEVSPVSDAASRTRRIRVELPNPEGQDRIVPGEPAWVRFTPPTDDWKKRALARAGVRE